MTTVFTSTLPGHYYTDPAVFEREKRNIFSQQWMYVCRVPAGNVGAPAEQVTPSRASRASRASAQPIPVTLCANPPIPSGHSGEDQRRHHGAGYIPGGPGCQPPGLGNFGRFTDGCPVTGWCRTASRGRTIEQPSE